MKILLLSDEESPYYWDYFKRGRLDGIDLIISCGDLKSEYLSFLVTMGRAPVLYVHGNHDGGYEQFPPEGCDSIDGKLVTVKGLRILGLGGCRLYSGGEHQYSEKQMRRRIRRLEWKLRRAGGVDILVTHAPARGLGDDDDPAHLGFECVRKFIDRWQPRYHVHGHVHLRYGAHRERIMTSGNTTVINACGYYILEIEDPEPKLQKKTNISKSTV